MHRALDANSIKEGDRGGKGLVCVKVGGGGGAGAGEGGLLGWWSVAQAQALLRAYPEQALQSSWVFAKSPRLLTPDQKVSNLFKSSTQSGQSCKTKAECAF